METIANHFDFNNGLPTLLLENKNLKKEVIKEWWSNGRRYWWNKKFGNKWKTSRRPLKYRSKKKSILVTSGNQETMLLE